AVVARDDHAAERQLLGVEDAAAGRAVAAGDGQAAEADGARTGVADREDAAVAPRVHGEGVGPRPPDVEVAGDGQLPQAQGDGAVQAGGEGNGRIDAGQLDEGDGLAQRQLAGGEVVVEVVGQGVHHRLRSRVDRDGVRAAGGSREVADRNG